MYVESLFNKVFNFFCKNKLVRLKLKKEEKRVNINPNEATTNNDFGYSKGLGGMEGERREEKNRVIVTR